MSRVGTIHWPQRALALALGAGLAAALLTIALPHRHGDAESTAAHHAHACRLAKIQEGFSASALPTPALLIRQAPTTVCALVLHERIVDSPTRVSSAPRAPPSRA